MLVLAIWLLSKNLSNTSAGQTSAAGLSGLENRPLLAACCMRENGWMESRRENRSPLHFIGRVVIITRRCWKKSRRSRMRFSRSILEESIAHALFDSDRRRPAPSEALNVFLVTVSQPALRSRYGIWKPVVKAKETRFGIPLLRNLMIPQS